MAITAAGAQAMGIEDRPRVQQGEGVPGSSGRAWALQSGPPCLVLGHLQGPSSPVQSMVEVPAGGARPRGWHRVKAGADQPEHAVVPGGLGEVRHRGLVPV